MDIGKRLALKRYVAAIMDSQAVDLLTLRDDLRKLADIVNDTYMNTPQLYRHTCMECRVEFSIMCSHKEDRRPDTCVECVEGDGKVQSILREPKYEYTRYENDRTTIIPTGWKVGICKIDARSIAKAKEVKSIAIPLPAWYGFMSANVGELRFSYIVGH